MNVMRPYLMVAPAVLILAALFVGGLGLAVAQSLGYLPFIGQTDLSLRAYGHLLTDPEFYQSLAHTLWLSLTSTTLATLLAVVSALALQPAFRGQRGALFVFQLNLPIPHVVGALGLLFLIAPSGWLARWAFALGLIQAPADFPALVYDPLGVGIILEYVWKGVPFIGTVALAALHTVEADYGPAARTLGATYWQRLRYITLPLIAPSVLAASVLVFAHTFGAYEVPFLLGQRYPSALPVLAYRRYADTDLAARPEAMALSVLIALLSTALIAVYGRLTRAAPS
jgi:putative spermidine/putrescine transport system permease protein